jgi:hypothetical protein
VDGCLISWVDYKNELRQWIDEVLPLTEQAGLREPFAPGRASGSSSSRAGSAAMA